MRLTARRYHLSSPSVLAGNFSSIALNKARASSAVGSRGTGVEVVVVVAILILYVLVLLSGSLLLTKKKKIDHRVLFL